jgi:hypothetical protein
MSFARLAKLRGRSLGEWRGRSSQVAVRWAERIGLGDVGEPAESDLERWIAEDSAGSAVRGPFFASLADRPGTLQALGEVDRELVARLRARVDRFLAGHCDLSTGGGILFPAFGRRTGIGAGFRFSIPALRAITRQSGS